MKFHKILGSAATVFSGVKLGGARDPKLAALDRGVLSVGLMVAALDGAILPEEYEAFATLAMRCRGGSERNVRSLLDQALPPAGLLMAQAQVVTYSNDERLRTFVTAAEKALPSGFADGSRADLRRAFVLWVTIGVADGVFSDFEKAAVNALAWCFATARTKGRKGAPAALLESDFLDKAERLATDLAMPTRRARAEAELEALITA